ncbi:MAG: hypothetical protein V1740_00250 [Candidatus Woesearchaeota archaeon]
MLKKGQVTLFIIIGIFLIIIAGSYFLIRLASEEPAKIISPKIMPIKEYVESCIELTAIRGLEIQGKQGGYIDIPENIRFNSRAYLRNDLFGNIEHPFWFYDGINNSPTLDMTKSELTRYIENRLQNCLNFSGFNDFNITPMLNVPDVEVTYGDSSTIVNVDYPLKVLDLNTNELNRDIKGFRVSIPIRFKKAFNTALNIFDSENRDLFLEDKVIDLIAMTPEDEIPYTGVEFQCGRKHWSLSRITSRLKQLIRVNFPYIKFVNLPYDKDKFISVPDKPDTYESSYFNLHYLWDAGIEPDENMKAAVIFDDKFPFKIYANPSKDGRLSSSAEQAENMFTFICLNIWHFTYDVEFPVIIRVKDFATSNNMEYVFEFATNVIISHNLPDHSSLGRIITEPVDSADLEEYCTTDDSDYDITVVARNQNTNIEIEDVDITFVCGFLSCPIGRTDFIPDLGNIPALQTKVPYCVNAVLKANKTGYLDAKAFGNINTEFEGPYDINMEGVKKFDAFEVVMHPMINDEEVSAQEFPLGLNQVATIVVTPYDKEDLDNYAVYPVSGVDLDDEFILPIRLYADERIKYKVSIFISSGENIVGAYEGDWTPDMNDIDYASKIKFHVVTRQPGSVDDERNYLFFQGIRGYSEKIPKPELLVS